VFSGGAATTAASAMAYRRTSTPPVLWEHSVSWSFVNNHPVLAIAGGNCTLVLTRNDHVYYVGKHKSTGKATIGPMLVNALANNGHVVTCVGAGSQTVFCFLL
jgi:hypothetical protein